MSKFLKEVLSDETGRYSSKRISGTLCVLALVTCMTANTFGKFNVPSDALVDAVALFAFGSFGLTSLDKFTNRNSRATTNQENN
jgi:hypothetical protein